MKFLLIAYLLLFSAFFTLAEAQPPNKELFQEAAVQINLREPEYSDGVLTTTEGGIIVSPGMRLQAKEIVYTRKKEEYTLVAQGDLLLQYGDSTLVGKRIEYDFFKKRGILYCGRTVSEPWFFGGECIELLPEGKYRIRQGFATTSEQEPLKWQLKANKITVDQNSVSANNIQFRWGGIPLFWIPRVKTNLDAAYDFPLRFIIKWGGREGPRIGLNYRLYSSHCFKAFLRFDYRMIRGPGVGFETEYKSNNSKQHFHGIHYIARDTVLKASDSDQGESKGHLKDVAEWRYRLQGLYTNELFAGKTQIKLAYDKLSDQDMPTDYNDRSLQIKTANRTQFSLRHQEEDSLSHLDVVLRINSFQTLKQQLPTLKIGWRPFTLWKTGIVCETEVKASYLEFEYSHDLSGVRDYESSRLEFSQAVYRPFKCRYFTLLPEFAGNVIFYGNGPNDNSKWLAVGQLSFEANSHFYRQFHNAKHLVKPYVRYDYFLYPTVSPDEHFIFDIEDGWYRLNKLRVGIENNLFAKDRRSILFRTLSADLYFNAFFNTPSLNQVVPKAYATVTYYPTYSFKWVIDAGWDFSKGIVDHYNSSIAWTCSADFAVAMEWRHRSAFDWRKVDHNNYILDSFRSVDELADSELSDQRDTFLLHFFYRFYPTFAFEGEIRHGWNRKNQDPTYTEYQLSLLGTIDSIWHVKVAWKHREDDPFRLSFYISMGAHLPDKRRWQCHTPCLEF